MQQEVTLLQCPFLKQQCIEERCHLYTTMSVMKVSRIVSRVETKLLEGCVFILMLEAIKMSGNTSPIIPRGGMS